MKKMKRLLVVLLSGLMVLACAACGSSDSSSEETTVETVTGTYTTTADLSKAEDYKIEVSDEDKEAMEKEPAYGTELHYFVFDGCSSGPSLADALGYFEDAGLDVEGYVGEGASDAVATGKAEIVVDHLATNMVPATNGLDIVFTGGAHVGCKSIYALADSDYESTEDLKGTNIAVPSGIGGADYNIASCLLDKDGIDPLNDVTMKVVTADAAVASMQNGEISSAVLSDAFAWSLVEDGTLVKLRSLGDDDFVDLPCCLIVMNGSFVEENPVHAKIMTQCVQAAHSWLAEDPENAVQLLVDMELTGLEYEDALDFFNSLNFGMDDETATEGIEYYAKEYVDLGLITKVTDPQQIIDSYWKPLGD